MRSGQAVPQLSESGFNLEIEQKREKLWSLLKRNPLEKVTYYDEKIISEDLQGPYKIFDLTYKVSGSDEEIPAYLYLRLTRRPPGHYPAVVLVHCHGNNFEQGRDKVTGKPGEHDRGVALQLVEQGFTVLVPELRGFGQRIRQSHPYHSLKEKQKGKIGMQNEKDYLLVKGKTLLGENLRELQGAISLLQESVDIDPCKIGVIGYSGGGLHSLMLAALDTRVKAGVAICAVSSYEKKYEEGVKLDDTLVIPDQLVEFGDMDQILRLLGGRSFLSVSAQDDCYSLGAEEMCRQANDQLPEAMRTISCRSYPGGHQFSSEMRKVAYQFLAEHLA